MHANNSAYFVTQDQIGSSTLLTNVSGGVADCNAFYPFGEQDSSICATTNTTTHKFTGKERDPETASAQGGLDGLDYFGARYFTSKMGRFMSPDPSNAGADPSNPQSWNAYAYVLDNPETLTDPDGRHQVCGSPTYSTNPHTGALVVHANCHEVPDNFWWGVWDLFTTIPRGAGVALARFENLIPPSPIQLPHLDPATMTALGAVTGNPEGDLESGIKITESRLAHVLEEHGAVSALARNKSVFNAGEDIRGLIKAAESAPAETRGNVLIRTVDAGRTVGIDRTTGEPTSIYTVITKSSGELITAYPGRP